MEKSVITLPITPTANPPLGLIASILVGDFAARNLGLKFVLALGPQMLLKEVDRESTVQSFLRHLNFVGVRPDFVWRIDSKKSRDEIRSFTSILVARGLIRSESASVETCPCGALEKLTESVEWYEKRRLYTRTLGGLCCKFCQKLALRELKPVCRFFAVPGSAKINPFPNFYSKELVKQTEQIERTSFMVSRARESTMKITVNGNEFGLDEDFAWQMYLSTMPAYGFEPTVILGSNHNLRALVLIATLQNHECTTKPLTVLIPPYFLGEGRQRLGSEHGLELLANVHLKNSIRVLVGSSLNWTQKESVLQISQLPLLDKMSKRLEALRNAGQTINDISGFLKRCEYQRIRNTTASARGDKGVVDPVSLFGIVD
ncbi:MAG: hypothetical protein KW788_04395 [Candidatus Doudnabacteria bacterium]|nr:hypothetical protein [Candidatus Doudnabacteria bacterium]